MYIDIYLFSVYDVWRKLQIDRKSKVLDDQNHVPEYDK